MKQNFTLSLNEYQVRQLLLGIASDILRFSEGKSFEDDTTKQLIQDGFKTAEFIEAETGILTYRSEGIADGLKIYKELYK